jgi:hypothetical protein
MGRIGRSTPWIADRQSEKGRIRPQFPINKDGLFILSLRAKGVLPGIAKPTINPVVTDLQLQLVLEGV